MSRDTTIVSRQPHAIDDPLTELAREGAGALAQLLIAEADASVHVVDGSYPYACDRA